jgi:hypothetical protein
LFAFHEVGHDVDTQADIFDEIIHPLLGVSSLLANEIGLLTCQV